MTVDNRLPVGRVESANRCVVTTSWDDGYHLDERIAGLLTKYNVQATFYIPKESARRTASDELVRLLSQSFDIGAHGLGHLPLTRITAPHLQSELNGSMAYIEQLVSKECNVIAYPYGAYNEDVVACARNAGFRGARTIDSFRNAIVVDRFRLATTIQACPHTKGKTRVEPELGDARDLLAHSEFRNLFGASMNDYDWGAIARKAFDIIHSVGGVWHLWGHSWEVQEHNLWAELEAVLAYAMSHDNTHSISNSALVMRD